MKNNSSKHNICDYANLDYQEDFWQNEVDRSYENSTEHNLLKELFKYYKGVSLIDIGAGFGRLTPTYKDLFKKISLLDYSSLLLDKAKKKFEKDTNIEYIKANCYQMPIADNTFNIALSFRLMHHIEHVPDFLREVYRILKPGGILILEFANKKNFLEIARSFLGKSDKEPFSLAPYQYEDKVYYNFHPDYILQKASEEGFIVCRKYSISNFRHQIFKKVFPLKVLLLLEKYLRNLLSFLNFGPSIVIVLKKDFVEK